MAHPFRIRTVQANEGCRDGTRYETPFSFVSSPLLCAAFILGLALPPWSRAAKIDRFLTPEDLDGRMLLDQNGQPLRLVGVDHRRPVFAGGSAPTYLMIPLHGDEHIPATVPSLTVDLQPGESTSGPLDLDAQAKSELDALLASSRLAVVNTPDQSNLVELLARRDASSAPATSATPSRR